MNNTYVAQTDTIVDALNLIEAFEDKMNMFRTKYPKYNYTISLRCSQGCDPNEDTWNIEYNISNEE